MIGLLVLPHLPGFDARPTATGYLLAPSDARSGFIRYERRVRPLRSMSSLVAPRIANLRETERSPITALFTTEGEHAARLTILGNARSGDVWMRREFGIVFGDDFASIIDATCIDRADPDLFDAAVDKLVRGVSFGAALRRRRYRYAAPDRTPRVRDLETDWIRNDTLTVFPAERAGNEHALAIARRDGLAITNIERIDPASISPTPASIERMDDITLVTASSDTRWRVVATRARHGWLYAMELTGHRTSDSIEHRAIAEAPSRPSAMDEVPSRSSASVRSLVACIASIEPLPAPIRATPTFGAFEVE